MEIPWNPLHLLLWIPLRDIYFFGMPCGGYTWVLRLVMDWFWKFLICAYILMISAFAAWRRTLRVLWLFLTFFFIGLRYPWKDRCSWYIFLLTAAFDPLGMTSALAYGRETLCFSEPGSLLWSAIAWSLCIVTYGNPVFQWTWKFIMVCDYILITSAFASHGWSWGFYKYLRL